MGMPAVAKTIAVIKAVDIYPIFFIPVVRPLFKLQVNDTEPESTPLEAGVTAEYSKREVDDMKPVVSAEIPVEFVFRNPVAVVTAALTPGTMLCSSGVCTISLQDDPWIVWVVGWFLPIAFLACIGLLFLFMTSCIPVLKNILGNGENSHAQ